MNAPEPSPAADKARKDSWLDYLAKGISIITTAPTLALLSFTWVFAERGSTIDHPWLWYLFTLLCLTAFPLLAYPIAWLVPALKKQGRHAERGMAFIMATIGWFGGLITSYAANAPSFIKMVFITYCVNVALIMAVNVLLHFKASAHAAGTVGPVLLLAYLVGNAAWGTLILLPAVYWARLRMGRHTKSELIGGTACGIAATSAVLLAMG